MAASLLRSVSRSCGYHLRLRHLQVSVVSLQSRKMNFQVEPIRNPEIKYTQLFINNEFVDAVNGGTYTMINPITEEKMMTIQAADHADVEKAVQAAKAAFHRKSPWRTLDPHVRGELIYKVATLLEQNMIYVASLEAMNVGKLFSDAVTEVYLSVQVLKYMAGWVDKIQGKTIPSMASHFVYTRLEPIGVCGHIIPWNVPLFNATMKVASALAAGCCLILKPSEMTPLTALFLCSLIKEAGIPPGVVNVVPGLGDQAGEAISKHPEIRKVAFTGSTRIGRHLGEICAANVKRVTLELGGKSPLVVCPDFDLDEAAAMTVHACMVNSGQACINGTRTFVHESVYDEFVKKCVQVANARVLGDVFDPKTTQGPVISKLQFDKILGYIEKGKAEGAKLECGGARWGEKGYYIQPTVFSNVTDDMVIAKEEIFGPVMGILKWSDFEDVIERSNACNYGLASGILTNDMNKAMLYAQGVESGNVWINVYPYMSPGVPFGGVKDSGIGREIGEQGVYNYVEAKAVVVKLPYKHS